MFTYYVKYVALCLEIKLLSQFPNIELNQDYQKAKENNDSFIMTHIVYCL